MAQYFYASQQFKWKVAVWRSSFRRNNGELVAGAWESHDTVHTWTNDKKLATQKARRFTNSAFKRIKCELIGCEDFSPFRITAAETNGELLPTA